MIYLAVVCMLQRAILLYSSMFDLWFCKNKDKVGRSEMFVTSILLINLNINSQCVFLEVKFCLSYITFVKTIAIESINLFYLSKLKRCSYSKHMCWFILPSFCVTWEATVSKQKWLTLTTWFTECILYFYIVREVSRYKYTFPVFIS